MPNKVPVIGVGMPVYNGERFLTEAIESILGQTIGDLELIISDNASTDGTQEICRTFAARDTRIQYVRQAVNVGASENYNIVFRNARSKYFKWASSNDVCHQDFLAKCLAILKERSDVVLCYPRTRLFVDDPAAGQDYYDGMDAYEKSPCQRFGRIVQHIGFNNVMNGVIRSEILRKTKLIKPYFSSDIVLVAELALHGMVYEIPEFLFFRRMDEASATHLKSNEEVLRHYHPNNRVMMSFPHWKLHLGYLSAAVRPPLSLGERACVFLAVLRHLWWARHQLLNDFRLRDA